MYDLMEPMRPVVDRTVLRFINEQTFVSADFPVSGPPTVKNLGRIGSVKLEANSDKVGYSAVSGVGGTGGKHCSSCPLQTGWDFGNSRLVPSAASRIGRRSRDVRGRTTPAWTECRNREHVRLSRSQTVNHG